MENDQPGQYSIRPLTAADRPFILATFLNGFVKNQIQKMRTNKGRWSSLPSIFRALPTDVLCAHYHNQMVGHLDRAQCLVAGDSTDSVLLGYLVYQHPRTLIWIYVKPEFSGFGIDDDLLRSANLDRGHSPIMLPYRNSGQSRLLRENGYIV
jgi:hypothetical protein